MGTAQLPYLLRAMHEWMTDNGHTPHIVVDAQAPGVEVPPEHVHDGRIVLNIGMAATSNLELGNELISFQARFSGVARVVRVPTVAVQGIFARETGQGMLFSEPGAESDAATADEPSTEQPARRPHLTVIK